jgi:hypothetical protein
MGEQDEVETYVAIAFETSRSAPKRRLWTL